MLIRRTETDTQDSATPGADGDARRITLQDTTAETFELFIKWIYDRQFGLNTHNVFIMNDLAAQFEATQLQLACDIFFRERMPADFINWENVESLLRRANARDSYSNDTLRKRCIEFLGQATSDKWIRVWSLAEAFELTQLLEKSTVANCPSEPWVVPLFDKLSLQLQRDLLLHRLQKNTKATVANRPPPSPWRGCDESTALLLDIPTPPSLERRRAARIPPMYSCDRWRFQK
ncbi:hypothetical protein HDU87_005512 [Geranomyces variabilis]|uniref:BTB domain-containing protein n=1 Tax=Geranomyces variabilis TaxID=109894 RepID=A0AAD5THI5_9FUNG|nr:hypothetical protein HDU87_005512 [Geranomyces variabilis]